MELLLKASWSPLKRSYRPYGSLTGFMELLLKALWDLPGLRIRWSYKTLSRPLRWLR